MKGIQKLLNGEARKVGNHRVAVEDGFVKYYYHSTAICTVAPADRVYWIYRGGYNTSSTSRAINCYIRYFDSLGYKRILPGAW